MADKMDPGEDIIDVLYNKPGDAPESPRPSGSLQRKRPAALPRQLSNNLYQYGFDYQHPPSRNYYEDLFQIQRRNFHGSDSVYGQAEKRPLCRTDSSQYQGTYFSFPSPSRQEKLRRTQLYGSLRRQNSAAAAGNKATSEPPRSATESVDEGFYTPEADDRTLLRSIRKDVIEPDEEELLERRKREKLYVELPNGVKQRRLPLNEDCNVSRCSSRIYSSIESTTSEAPNTQSVEEEDKLEPEKPPSTEDSPNMVLIKLANTFVGIIVMVTLSNLWSNHLQQLHENDMWFSNIEEVKREISFRTEQGFYYSYFKHLIKAQSLRGGFQELERDNLTEHTNTINAWKRFNLYQELVLATIHRVYSFNMEPIMFYVEAVFSLQGFHAAMLFLISWSLSGTWMSGVLTMFFMVIHRSDVTRAPFTVPLREHFSLPFFYAMLVSVARYFEMHRENAKKISPNIWATKEFALVQIYVMTFIFVITWQFAQFALLLHSVLCYVFATAQLLQKEQVAKIFGVQLCAVMTVWYLQYFQSMVINSLVVSFLPLAILSLQSQVHDPSTIRQRTFLQNVLNIVTRTALVIIGTIALNMTLKSFLGQTDDNHIFQFVASWLGFQDETDFDTRLYRCLAVFRPLGWEMYRNLASNGALPIYFTFMMVQMTFLVLSLTRKWYVKEKEEPDKNKVYSSNSSRALGYIQTLHNDPDFHYMVNLDECPTRVYHIGISAIFAILGILMARMIVFWSPYIMIIASVSICDSHLWTLLINKLNHSRKNATLVSFLRHLVLFFAMATIYFSHRDSVKAQLEELREFWDPDTVDLMQWIVQKTPTNAAFAGTMQLMAGVRLCTFRPITNHPHFEDKPLRQRTRELYQMYGQFAPEDVYATMLKFNTSFIILEDSQCLSAGQNPDRCSMPDTVDLSYGHIPSDGKQEPKHLVKSEHPRFCDEIRYGSANYTKYFRLVFNNRTFRVYEVKPPKGPFSSKFL